MTRDILSDWRKEGIITDTQSPYASPVLLVKNKTGESRLRVVFRKLNQFTERVHFLLPNIDEHLSLIHDSALFIVLDLAHGYLQIPLSQEAREKTAIITILTNLDDIIIPGKSWTDLKEKLRLVFEALRKAGLMIKLEKSQLLYKRVPYLGHMISGNGIEPGSHKISAVIDFPVPRNAHEVQRFLGLTRYFRKYVPRFAQIATPPNELLRANATFEWGEARRHAFETLNETLAEQPVLQAFDPSAGTKLHTDASADELADMLMQRDVTNRLRLVYAISRRTSEPEKHYHSSKLELLAIVWAVTRLRPMLVNIPFTVITDCQALCHLSTQKRSSRKLYDGIIY